MSNSDLKFDNNLLFLLKFRKFIPSFPFFHFYFILMKYMPLFMIAHDAKVHQGHYINSLFSYLTITRIFNLTPGGVFPIILLAIIAASAIYFYYYLSQYYEKVKFKDDPLSNSKPSKYFKTIFMVFISTFILLNQNFYEVLFSPMLCDGIQNPLTKEVTLNTTCYDGGRYILIAISAILIIFLVIINFIFNLIYFQPWFSTDCLVPSTFNGSNLIWTLLPILQGYVVLEQGLPDTYSMIIRYVIRGLFLLYSLNFYFNLKNYIYVSKASLYIIIFMNTFNSVSIILEYIPMIASNLNDVTFVIVKIGFELSVSLIALYIFNVKEHNTLMGFSEWKSTQNFYELFSRYLNLLLFFEEDGKEKEFESVINQFLEFKIIKNNSNEFGHHNDKEEADSNKDLKDIYNNMKSIFNTMKMTKVEIDYTNKQQKKDAKNLDVLRNNKHKLILGKMDFYIKHLDEIFMSMIQDEKQNDLLRFKNIIIYSLFCNLIKRNYVSAFFYLEKLSFTRIYRTSFLLRLYYAQVKKLVCKDHHRIRIAENEEKSAYKKFFDNIKDFDKLFANLKMANDALKDLTLKVNSDSVNLLEYSQTLQAVEKGLKVISLNNNKNLKIVLSTLIDTEENSALISRYVIFNSFVFKNNTITENMLFEAQDTVSSSVKLNDKYVMAYLDENEDIYILKVEKKTQALLGYDGVDLKGTNLLAVIPPTIGKYHKKLTTAFTSSNKDFRRIDVFFITKDKYNIPNSATLIIFPMFDDRILFFVMAELSNKPTDLNAGNPLQLPGTDFKCFAELNNQCEIVTINREFERVFGFNRDIIESPSGKFNFLTRVLRLQVDKIFNRFDHVQHYETRLPFVTVFDNIKKLNYDEFREYSLEAYYKFKSFLTNFNLKRYPDVIMKIFIERRIIDRTDNDFFFSVVLSLERTRKTDKDVKGSEIIRESYIDQVNTPHLEAIQNMREKKLVLVSQEIYNMSKKMLVEGRRLWNGDVKYSEITDLTDENKLLNAFEDKPDDKKNPKKNLAMSGETTIFEVAAESSHKGLFKMQNLVIFVVLSIFLILFYSIFFDHINNKYSMALQIYSLNISILRVKFSQVITAFLLTQNFIIETGQFPNTTDYIKSTEDLQFYVNALNENFYQFQQTFSILSSDSRYNSTLIGTLVNNARTYKTIVTDFSIYNRNFSYYDVIDIFRLRVENFDHFENMTFSLYPNEVVQNGLTFDINKKFFPKSVATQGDLLIYQIINDFVDYTIPLSDSILTENKNILSSFVSGLINIEILFFAILFVSLLVFFFYLYDYFYSGKKFIYERYFVMFNIVKYFTPYLLKKLNLFDELLANYTKDKYELFMKLDFDISTENINSSLIRFDKENNSLIVFNGQDAHKLEKKPSLFSQKTIQKTATVNNANKLKKMATNKSKTSNNDLPEVGNVNSKEGRPSAYKNMVTSTPRGGVAKDNFAVENDNTNTGQTQNNTNNNATNSPLKSMKSNLGLLKQETRKSKLGDEQNLQQSGTPTPSANTKKAKDKKKKKSLDDDEEDVDDAIINPRLLLKAKNSYYFDFYFLLIIVVLFLVLNIIFLIIILNYTSNINSLSDYTNMAIDLSYSQIEISLIFLVTMLRQKEIKNPNGNVLFNDKVASFTSDTHNIFVDNSILTDLMTYHSDMYTPISCSTILSNYYTLSATTSSNIPNEVANCQRISGGIYAKGLVLGFETLINNMMNNYNANSIKAFKVALYDENVETIFNTRNEVLEKNIYNIIQLIQSGTNTITSSTTSSLTLYYVLFFILYVFLVLSYCFIYMYTKISYNLMNNMEILIDKLLK